MTRLLFLLVMLIALPLRAAEPEAPAPAVEEEQEADEESTDLEAEDAALAEEIRVAEEAARNAPPSDPNEPFVPSVQISEDLSVSFPVDI